MKDFLIEQLKRLSKEELAEIISQINKTQLSAKRFENGFVCPICGKKYIQKFGSSSGIQRYRCKDCGKPLQNILKPYFSAPRKIIILGFNILN